MNGSTRVRVHRPSSTAGGAEAFTGCQAQCVARRGPMADRPAEAAARTSPPGHGAPISTHRTRSATCSSDNRPWGGICKFRARVPDGLDEPALFRLPRDEGRAAFATLEQALATVHQQPGLDLLRFRRMAPVAVFREQRPHPALEELDALTVRGAGRGRYRADEEGYHQGQSAHDSVTSTAPRSETTNSVRRAHRPDDREVPGVGHEGLDVEASSGSSGSLSDRSGIVRRAVPSLSSRGGRWNHIASPVPRGVSFRGCRRGGGGRRGWSAS